MRLPEILAGIALLMVSFWLLRGRGLLTASGLVCIHLLLGFGVKAVYTRYIDPYEKSLLAPFVLAPNDLSLQAALLVMSSFFCGCVLYTFVFTQPNKAWLRLPVLSLTYSPNKKLVLTSLMILPILSVTLFMVAKFGGLSAAAEVFAGRVADDVAGFGYILALGDLGVVSGVALYAYSRMESKPLVRLATRALAFLVPLAYLAFTGGRGNLIQFVLSILLVDSLARRSRASGSVARYLVTALLGALVVVVGLANRLSTQHQMDFAEAMSEVGSEFGAALMSPFALVDHYELSRRYVEEVGHSYGSIYLNTVTKPIPRVLWPGKPQTLALTVREHYWGDTQGGIPPGFFGEAYISGAEAAVVIMGVLLGLMSSSIDRTLQVARQIPSYACAASLFVPYFAFNLLRSGWDISFTRMAIYIASVWLVGRVVAATESRSCVE